MPVMRTKLHPSQLSSAIFADEALQDRQFGTGPVQEQGCGTGLSEKPSTMPGSMAAGPERVYHRILRLTDQFLAVELLELRDDIHVDGRRGIDLGEPFFLRASSKRESVATSDSSVR